MTTPRTSFQTGAETKMTTITRDESIRTRFEGGAPTETIAREMGLTEKQVDASLRSTAKSSLRAATLQAQSGLYISKELLTRAYRYATEVAGRRSNDHEIEAGATADSLRA